MVVNLSRRKLFIEWYKVLRKKGYSWHNCVMWAWSNSGTHNLDESYVEKKPYSNKSTH